MNWCASFGFENVSQIRNYLERCWKFKFDEKVIERFFLNERLYKWYQLDLDAATMDRYLAINKLNRCFNLPSYKKSEPQEFD